MLLVEEEILKEKKIENKKFLSEGYKAIEKLGKGTYGTVYKAEKISTGDLYAIKKIKLDSELDGIPSTTLREISILKKMKHPNIVR